MKNLRLLAILMILMVGVFMVPTLSYGQQSWETRLAQRFANAVLGIQKFCIERGKVECELLEFEPDPPLLLEGQVIDYIGVRKRGVLYFYLVVAESENMGPNIYLFDSDGKLLSSGTEGGGIGLGIHTPEYTQKVFQRIKMFKGSGHIGFAVLAPVGSY